MQIEVGVIELGDLCLPTIVVPWKPNVHEFHRGAKASTDAQLGSLARKIFPAFWLVFSRDEVPPGFLRFCAVPLREESLSDAFKVVKFYILYVAEDKGGGRWRSM
ncbi:hypothetical protein DRO31_04380 [Candidatus Bathyarchaeota archaeon]|nr:MAG: hypothetical protein DRO31_04380 [Candidatus Bathyarchaeota archaeon]